MLELALPLGASVTPLKLKLGQLGEAEVSDEWYLQACRILRGGDGGEHGLLLYKLGCLCARTRQSVRRARRRNGADLVKEGENGLLADVDDVESLAASASRLLEDADLKKTVVLNARHTACHYNWSAIAKRYHEEVYRPLLLEAGYQIPI